MKKKTGKMPAGLAAYWKAKRSKVAKSTKKSVRKKKVSRRVKIAPPSFIITAKGTGKKMHYDGSKFSERAAMVKFKTADAAATKARALIKQYPVLNKYRIAVETCSPKG